MSNNSRIAKNTLALYSRTLLSLFVSLYTSRITLQALGIEDFGIYSVVAGFVTMLIFMNNTLASAASRFFAFEIGKKKNNLSHLFKSTLTTHLIFGVIMVIILETAGLWFLNNKMVIPVSRIGVANWVFHFSVISAFVGIIQVPATALIIAKEEMKIYAYLGLVAVFIRLVVAFTLTRTSMDRLLLFSMLLTSSTILVFVIYNVYCKRMFQEFKLALVVDKEILKEMLAYTGWGFVGSLANILKIQGSNILLNIFFGPVVNAARGIAMQVNTAINSFVTNFTMAMNPQIIKKYASGNIKEMLLLVEQGSRFSFYLLFFLSLPVLMQTKFILNLWLVNVPMFAVVFTQLIIINSLVESFAYSISAALQSTGDIKSYQLVIGGIYLLNIPLSYLLLGMGYAPVVTLYVSIALALVSVIARLLILKTKIKQFKVLDFLRNVYGKAILVSVLAIVLPLFASYWQVSGWWRFFLISITCISSTLVTIWFFGLQVDEKSFINLYIRRKLNYTK